MGPRICVYSDGRVDERGFLVDWFNCFFRKIGIYNTDRYSTVPKLGRPRSDLCLLVTAGRMSAPRHLYNDTSRSRSHSG